MSRPRETCEERGEDPRECAEGKRCPAHDDDQRLDDAREREWTRYDDESFGRAAAMDRLEERQ